MKAAKLLAAFSIALVSLTACEPTRNTQMYELNGMVFQLSYTNWKWYSANVSRNGRAYYPYMDWSTDEVFQADWQRTLGLQVSVPSS